MRVDYTLPGLDLGTLPELPSGVETPLSFRDQVRSQTVELPVDWQHEMQLDARPATATYIGPPPRPKTLELGDASAQRSQWRSMLSHHTSAAASGGQTATGTKSVHVMLDMLSDLQQAEDSLVAYNVSVSRG